MRASARRLTLPLLAVLAASGCTTWGPQRLPEPSSSQSLPSPVRVTRADASTLVVFDATMAADSLVGFTGDDPASRLRVAVATSEVRKLEAKKTSAAATVGIVAAIALALGAVVVALGSSGGTAY